MDFIKIAKVPDVICTRLGKSSIGTLHLTTHHVIFRDNESKRELWICYPIIAHVERRYSNSPAPAPIPEYALSSISNNIPERTEISSNPYENSQQQHAGPTATSVIKIPKINHHTPNTIRIRCKDFTFIAFSFATDAAAKDTFDSLLRLTCVSDVSRLYAFIYKPVSHERSFNGWTLYDPLVEFRRMGALPQASASKLENDALMTQSRWRLTNINADYKLSPTYPAVLVIPACISDSVLSYGAKFRSKARVPALTYYHAFNGCTITRCSQPMVGFKQSRSAQDEKIAAAIFASNQPANSTLPNGQRNKDFTAITPGNKQDNLIVDARPTANAMAQTALGAGSENMENYKGARKVYLGIDNIHVMRDSLNRIVEALKEGDLSARPPSKEALYKSNWLRYISTIMDGAVTIAQQVHVAFSHVLIHCSDGWDRTAQLAALAEIMLDPYYRTLDGFMVLVEKEWLSFGHRFADRCGHLNSERNFVETQVGSRGSSDYYGNVNGGANGSNGSSNGSSNGYSQAHQVLRDVGSKFVKSTMSLGSGGSGSGGSNMKYTSPVFHQFLDAVYQMVVQFPERFEFGERFLRRLLYHTYSCQYGTFLYNNEAERKAAGVEHKTRSVWDYFLARRHEFVSKGTGYDRAREFAYDADKTVIVPNTRGLKYWAELFGRSSEEMNSRPREKDEVTGSASSTTLPIDGQQQQPQQQQGNKAAVPVPATSLPPTTQQALSTPSSSSSPATAAASAIASIFNNITSSSLSSSLSSLSELPGTGTSSPLSQSFSSLDKDEKANNAKTTGESPTSSSSPAVSFISATSSSYYSVSAGGNVSSSGATTSNNDNSGSSASAAENTRTALETNVDPLGNTPVAEIDAGTSKNGGSGGSHASPSTPTRLPFSSVRASQRLSRGTSSSSSSRTPSHHADKSHFPATSLSRLQTPIRHSSEAMPRQRSGSGGSTQTARIAPEKNDKEGGTDEVDANSAKTDVIQDSVGDEDSKFKNLKMDPISGGEYEGSNKALGHTGGGETNRRQIREDEEPLRKTKLAEKEGEEQLDPKVFTEFGAMSMMDYDDTGDSSPHKSAAAKLRDRLGLF